MTAAEVNKVRARTIQRQMFWLALEVASRGWIAEDHLTIDGLAISWRSCAAPMGLS